MRRPGQIRHFYGFRGAVVEQVDEPIGAVPSLEEATRTLLLLIIKGEKQLAGKEGDGHRKHVIVAWAAHRLVIPQNSLASFQFHSSGAIVEAMRNDSPLSLTSRIAQVAWRRI